MQQSDEKNIIDPNTSVSPLSISMLNEFYKPESPSPRKIETKTNASVIRSNKRFKSYN